MLWRVKADLRLDPLEFHPDGSYRSVLVNPGIRGKAREKLLEAARAGADLDPEEARYVRVIEYEVPDREGDGKDEIIALITTILDFPDAPAAVLARASTRTASSSREPSASSGAGPRARLFSPDRHQRILDRVMAGITSPDKLSKRRERSYPRVVKRARHNHYPVRKPGQHGTRHDAPATIKIANPILTSAKVRTAA